MIVIIILLINQTWATRTPFDEEEIIFPVKSTPRKTGFKDYGTLREELLEKFMKEEIDEQIGNLNETILDNLIEKLKRFPNTAPNTDSNTDLDEELLKHFPPSKALAEILSFDNTRIEKIESTINELLNILKHSKRSKIHMDLLNKIEQIEEERIKFESQRDQKLTPKRIRNLFKINFNFIDAIHTSLIKEIEEMEYSEEHINKLIKQIK
jgi:hypothetical protein